MLVALLRPSDAPRYRTLMLEAYEKAAEAFTSTAEEREKETQAWWVKRVAHPEGLSESFGAFDGENLVGTVALEYSAQSKTRHAALLIGMYVQAQARGQGLGRKLTEVAVATAAAKPEIKVINLTLTEGNTPAMRLYESLGFTAWGTAPRAIRAASGFKGKVHMALILGNPRSAALYIGN